MRVAFRPLCLLLALLAPPALAEPYIAVREGFHCGTCHVNRTGGGMRNSHGAGYGARVMPRIELRDTPLFDGRLHERVRGGVDFRGSYSGNFPDDDDGHFIGEFLVDRASLYLSFELLKDRLTLYVDEQVAPGSAASREIFALLRARGSGLYVKAGKFFQPYGLRIEDDAAPIRRFTGFNFDVSDTGVEVGTVAGPWSGALAVTNGTGTTGDADNGKQVSFTGTHVRERWRVGVSASSNDLPGREQLDLAGAFTGIRAGPFVLLGEFDLIRNRPLADSDVYAEAWHAEVDWFAIDGLVVRLWYGEFLADRDLGFERREQLGLGADLSLLPGLQLRLFWRENGGPSPDPGARDDEAFFQLHLYF